MKQSHTLEIITAMIILFGTITLSQAQETQSLTRLRAEKAALEKRLA
jgi:hypothetical protein